MAKLADYGLTITNDAKKRWLIRRGIPVAITSLQRDMLEWFDGAVTPSLACCCDALWEQVDVAWVRGQWDKLGALMMQMGVAVMMDDRDMLSLALVDADGCLVQPLREERSEAEAVEQPAISQADNLAEKLASAAAQAEEFRVEREAEQLRAQIAEFREAAQAQLIIVNQAKEALAERDALRMQVAVRDLELVKIRQLNDGLGREAQDRLERLLKAEEEIARLKERNPQPSAEVVHLRDYPVRIAPRYLTVPVSEPLFRWLEAAGDRNRRSADDMARALLVAFMRSAGNREAA